MQAGFPVCTQRDAIFSAKRTEAEQAQNEPRHCKTNAPPPEMKTPAALAGATGADQEIYGFRSTEYQLRFARARTLAFAIAECDPRDACQIMAAALDDLSAGMPGAPLFSYTETANWWADLASETELKAYLLACWSRLPAKVQADFLAFIGRRTAA